MHLSEIQRVQERFVREMRWDRFNATQVFSHLVEELGEIIRHFLYMEEYKIKGAGHEGSEGSLAQEFAQAFNLLLQLASHADVDLEQAWIKEREAMQERFDVEQWKEIAEKKLQD